jgi:hypothetical protein
VAASLNVETFIVLLVSSVKVNAGLVSASEPASPADCHAN